MTLIGTKTNPHPYKRGQKDRIKGHYYLKKNEVLYWDGRMLRNKEKIKDYRKKNKEATKKYKKEYYEKNKEKIKEYNEKNKGISKEYQREYREKNKGISKEYHREYREKNKEKLKEYAHQYHEKNKEKINREAKEYYEKNKEKISKYYKEKQPWKKAKRKKKSNEYQNQRYRNDPIFRLSKTMRSRTLAALKAQGASKNKRTMQYINCSIAHLYNHIESQFGDSGMNWDNSGRNCSGLWYYGRGWEIDHRRPCDSFDLNNEEEKYMCFHWSNLQPMWGQENNAKGDDYDPETFPYKWVDREIGWIKK